MQIEASQMPAYMAEVEVALYSGRRMPGLKDVHPVLRQEHRRYFAGEHDPDGSPWPQWNLRALWSPPAHSTLFVTGNLAGSVVDPGHPDHIEETKAREAVFGTSLHYASIQHDGATFKLGIPLVSRDGAYIPVGTQITIPARPFVGVGREEALETLDSVVADAAFDVLFGSD